MNTFGYAEANPLRYIDPMGLFLINPITVSAAEGLINTIGGGVIINEMFGGTSSVTDDIANMPAANDDQMCSKPGPDDPDECELQKNFLIIEEIRIREDARGAPRGANEIGYYQNIKARKKAWNRSVDQYNKKCPSKIGRRFTDV